MPNSEQNSQTIFDTTNDEGTVNHEGNVNNSTTSNTGTGDPGTEQVFLKVGDRVFKAEEEVVTKIVNQDEHISRIEQENAELRERLEAAAELEALKRKSNESSAQAGSTEISKDEIREIVSSLVQETEAQRQARLNLLACNDKSVEVFGSEEAAKAAVAKRAAELGLSATDIKDMAETKPALYMSTFLGKENTKETRSTDTGSGNVQTGNVNTQAFERQSGGALKEGSYSFYMQKIKEDPNNSWKYQNEIVKNVQSQGPEYFNT